METVRLGLTVTVVAAYSKTSVYTLIVGYVGNCDCDKGMWSTTNGRSFLSL